MTKYLEIAREAMKETTAGIAELGIVKSPRGYEKNEIRESAFERQRWPEHATAQMPLRRCGALICRTCHVHSPSPHERGCAFPGYDPCRSRWFWLSPHGAIKCVACAAPSDLTLVEAWVLARETGEGEDGWRIPGEILALLHIAALPQ